MKIALRLAVLVCALLLWLADGHKDGKYVPYAGFAMLFSFAGAIAQAVNEENRNESVVAKTINITLDSEEKYIVVLNENGKIIDRAPYADNAAYKMVSQYFYTKYARQTGYTIIEEEALKK